VSEIDVLQARVNVARRRADQEKLWWEAESRKTTQMAQAASLIGKRDGFKGEAFRASMSDVAAQRGRSRTAWRIYVRAEEKAQSAQRALNRARTATGGRA